MAKIPLYNLMWLDSVHPAARELDCIRMGGRWKKKMGGYAGEGLLFHYRKFVEIVWPEIKWHRWIELVFEKYLESRIIGILGPASSGKTHDAAVLALIDYYANPTCTTTLLSSTTRESLEMRIWGEIKMWHKLAKSRISWLPGNLIEGRQRIVTDEHDAFTEGRDFRNGLCGVACKKGQNMQGLADYVGVKNKILRLMADELHFMNRDFVDSIANLNKNPNFKCMGLGNPKETMDALGILCEPAAHLGGWDGGIDQTPGTKSWETRFNKGVCIQLVGSDSPNLDGKLGIPLITQEQIDADIKFYGKESLQFTMMNEGRMPRGQGSRRVITRNFCLKFNAMEKVIWKDLNQINLAGLDAGYRGVGGDRTIFIHLQIGTDTQNRQILNLAETLLVPVSVERGELAEDQIVNFVRQQCEARKIKPDHVFFDSTGRGSLVSAFARLWSALVEPIEFGGPPSDRKVSADLDIYCKDYYFNFVTELWFLVRHVIESGQFRGMTEEVMAEGCMREWTLVTGNKHQVEPKDKMKIKSGRSPDLFDALAVGCEGARRCGFVVSRLGTSLEHDAGRVWRDDLRARARRFWRQGELNHAA